MFRLRLNGGTAPDGVLVRDRELQARPENQENQRYITLDSPELHQVSFSTIRRANNCYQASHAPCGHRDAVTVACVVKGAAACVSSAVSSPQRGCRVRSFSRTLLFPEDSGSIHAPRSHHHSQCCRPRQGVPTVLLQSTRSPAAIRAFSVNSARCDAIDRNPVPTAPKHVQNASPVPQRFPGGGGSRGRTSPGSRRPI